jgi:hypothetical protein
MADSVPVGWRPLWWLERNAVRHDVGTLSAIVTSRRQSASCRGRGVSTQAFSTVTLRPIFMKERGGDPAEACDAQDQGHSSTAFARWRDQLPADRTRRRLRQDGGRRMPAAGVRGGSDDVGGRGGARGGSARAAVVSRRRENVREAEHGAPVARLDVDPGGAWQARPPGHADALVDGVQGRAPGRLSVFAVRRALSVLREEALGRAAPAPSAWREGIRRFLRRDRADRPGERGEGADASVRRRARRELLYVCRRNALASAAGLARLPCADVRVLPRRQRPDDTGQPVMWSST